MLIYYLGNRIVCLAELQHRARAFIAETQDSGHPWMILLEELCRESDKIMEDSKKDHEDLVQQVSEFCCLVFNVIIFVKNQTQINLSMKSLQSTKLGIYQNKIIKHDVQIVLNIYVVLLNLEKSFALRYQKNYALLFEMIDCKI